MYVFSSTLIVEHYIYVKEIWFGKKKYHKYTITTTTEKYPVYLCTIVPFL
jgi:hypothetical protein